MRPRTTEIALLVAVFLDMVGFTMLIPDIQLRAQTLLGDSKLVGPIIGLLLQITFVIQIIASPRWGKLSDATGRRRIFILCQILSAAAMLLYGLANHVMLLFASRCMAGFGAANVSIAQAIASSQAGEDRKRMVMGWMSAALSGGMVFGPAIGGFASSKSGSHVIGYVGAVISLIGALLVMVFVKDDTHVAVEPKKKEKLLDFTLLKSYPSVRSLFWIAVTASFALATLEGTFGRLIKQLLGMGQREFGLIFSYEALLGIAVSAFGLAWLSKKICETTLLRSGYVMQAVGLGLNPLAGYLATYMPGLFWLFLASTLYALGVGVVNPTLSTMSSNAVPEDAQGELFGLMQSARTVGFVIGPILGGALFDTWFAAPYILASAVCLVVAFVLPNICRCHPKIAQPI